MAAALIFLKPLATPASKPERKAARVGHSCPPTSRGAGSRNDAGSCRGKSPACCLSLLSRPRAAQRGLPAQLLAVLRWEKPTE